jgi:hypothetical protein
MVAQLAAPALSSLELALIFLISDCDSLEDDFALAWGGIAWEALDGDLRVPVYCELLPGEIPVPAHVYEAALKARMPRMAHILSVPSVEDYQV